jgi:dolichyl-phosphate-mannose--protein O-mannosyl transferase
LTGAQNKRLKLLILGGFLLNWLPFISIGRVMFLYHYMVALIFAILALAHIIDENKYRNKIFAVLIILNAAAFIFFAPLTYGLPLTESAYNLRAWFPAWK